MSAPVAMTADRRAHLLRAIAKLPSLAEFHAFRVQLSLQGEAADSEVFAALEAQVVILRRREGGR